MTDENMSTVKVLCAGTVTNPQPQAEGPADLSLSMFFRNPSEILDAARELIQAYGAETGQSNEDAVKHLNVVSVDG